MLFRELGKKTFARVSNITCTAFAIKNPYKDLYIDCHIHFMSFYHQSFLKDTKLISNEAFCIGHSLDMSWYCCCPGCFSFFDLSITHATHSGHCWQHVRQTVSACKARWLGALLLLTQRPATPAVENDADGICSQVPILKKPRSSETEETSHKKRWKFGAFQRTNSTPS